MGEYALHQGESIKIGTCEGMYYLRADQAHQVVPQPGNVDPTNPEHLEVIRFRFPWPDEDRISPGAFDRYDRSVGLYGLEVPDELADEHHSVQFVASIGYNVCLPCPESGKVPDGLKVHRNGFAGPVRIAQQAWRGGRLVTIAHCGGCGLAYRLETLEDAQPALDELERKAAYEAHQSEVAGHGADASSADWYREVARRIAAGYSLTLDEWLVAA